MTGVLLPIVLVVGGIITALITYRNIRRGGARFYTLEREIVLRRAALTLAISVLLFLSAFVLMFLQQQQLIEASLPPVEEESLTAGDDIPLPEVTPTLLLQQFPPTASPTSLTPEATITATAVVCRGVVAGTGGNGLYLRDAPQGAEIVILPDGSLLTVLEDEPVDVGGVIWRKVRAIGGDEGWVADTFLTIRQPCGSE